MPCYQKEKRVLTLFCYIECTRYGWTKCGMKLEDDLYNEGIDWEYDEIKILSINA